MTLHQVPIVGMNFRPPADQVIMLVPEGSPLILMHEPTNPYDPNAIRVLLPNFTPDGPYEHIFEHLVETIEADAHCRLKWGFDQLTDPLHLGYVANGSKTGGHFADEVH